MGKFRTSSYTKREHFNGKHRFEHWYRDNTVYFITSKARDGVHVFQTEQAKNIFWDRLNHWAQRYGFEPWITSVMSNHYHTVGYLRIGENLGPFMQKLHGSVAKLVNDTLLVRHLPFWRTAGNKDYFDGCLRDENQLRRTYRYVQRQSIRAGLVQASEAYAHTRFTLTLKASLEIAKERHAYLPDIEYARYQSRP